MALTPTEREEHFFKAMVDAADGSTPEELEPTERKEHWYKEIIDAIAAGGGGSGGGGVLVVHVENGTLDKTWQEIHDAFYDGEIRVELGENNVGAVLGVANVGGGIYGVCVCDATERTPFKTYFAESASSYPAVQ